MPPTSSTVPQATLSTAPLAELGKIRVRTTATPRAVKADVELQEQG